MTLLDLLTVAVGLSMDALAVSVCKGLSMERVRLKDALVVGAWFGGFQALMPLLGYLIGSRFDAYIRAFDHWIAFGLLSFIGGNMIREALSRGGEEKKNASLAWGTMLVLAVSTSIDALAVGVTFAFLGAPIFAAVCCIGAIAFALSALGLKIGNAFGARFKTWAEFTGGAILILMGIKILLEHLGML